MLSKCSTGLRLHDSARLGALHLSVHLARPKQSSSRFRVADLLWMTPNEFQQRCPGVVSPRGGAHGLPRTKPPPQRVCTRIWVSLCLILRHGYKLTWVAKEKVVTQKDTASTKDGFSGFHVHDLDLSKRARRLD